MDLPPLLSLLPDELVAQRPMLSLHEARRILSLAHRHGALPAITPAGIRRVSLDAVRASYSVQRLVCELEQPSAIDPFVKYALRAPDGAVIETVRIPLLHPGRFSVCVSSQVGCAMGCAFCGTARLGLRRSLQAWEIVEQVRVVRDALPPATRVHGVVFQGMGEPLANVREVIRAARILSEPSAMAIDARNITVCTAGLGTALDDLFVALPNIRIGISIGSAIESTRARLMPLQRAQPLRAVLAKIGAQAAATHISPMWAYTFLAGVNDTDQDLAALEQLVREFVDACGVRPRISLLHYNRMGDNDPFSPSEPERVEAFRQRLGSMGIPVVRRYSGGSDVAAACGQLGLMLRDR